MNLIQDHSVPTFRALALILAIAVGPTTGCSDTWKCMNELVDGDADGYGYETCKATTADCDDENAAVNPSAEEICDSIDNDCDGEIDNAADATTWYLDADADGYGDDEDSLEACDQPEGYVDLPGDCDDGNSAVNPAATEICNTIDDDCDGEVDEDVTNTYYADADGDGYGDATNTMEACELVDGWVEADGDCDDISSQSSPHETEICDGIDNNCDGEADEGIDTITVYPDEDGDGYGAGEAEEDCEEFAGYSVWDGDCDDGDINTYPGAIDSWYDGVDSDCLGDNDCDQDGDSLIVMDYEDTCGVGDDCDDELARVGVCESEDTGDSDTDTGTTDTGDSEDSGDSDTDTGGGGDTGDSDSDTDTGDGDTGDTDSTDTGDTEDSGDTGETGDSEDSDTEDSGDSGETGDSDDSDTDTGGGGDTGDSDSGGDTGEDGTTVLHTTDFGTATGSCSVAPFRRSDGGTMAYAISEGIDPETGALVCGVYVFGGGSSAGPSTALIYSASDYTVETDYVVFIAVENIEAYEVTLYADLGGGEIYDVTVPASSSNTLEVYWTADDIDATLQIWTDGPTNYDLVVTGLTITY